MELYLQILSLINGIIIAVVIRVINEITSAIIIIDKWNHNQNYHHHHRRLKEYIFGGKFINGESTQTQAH